jgi:hypothetical protein
MGCWCPGSGDDDCYLCYGRRGHARLREVFCEGFENELLQAERERNRLNDLFMDVCWYNFETSCSKWKYPWNESFPDSNILLYGNVIESENARGRVRESGRFPVYYDGPVCDAPTLPPEVLLVELQAARAYVAWCKEQVTAPMDWAPGGIKYNELLQTTSVPTALSRGALISGACARPDANLYIPATSSC